MMPNPGQAADTRPVNLTLTREAIALLQKHVPSRRGHGRFLSKLLVEHDARGQFEDLWTVARKELRKAIRDVAKEAKGEVRDKD